VEGMTIATGDTAKIIMGCLLIVAGLTNLWDALRSGYTPYVSRGIDRLERPLLFWGMVAVYVGLALGGLDLAIGGIFHVRTFWG
jgi:hypothetical protein